MTLVLWNLSFQEFVPFGDTKENSQTGCKTGDATDEGVVLFSIFILLYLLSQFLLQKTLLVMKING